MKIDDLYYQEQLWGQYGVKTLRLVSDPTGPRSYYSVTFDNGKVKSFIPGSLLGLKKLKIDNWRFDND